MENNQTELKQNNRKTSLMIIGLAILVISLVGITYAFFNYTRTGSANTIRVGKMAFSSNQTETINLTNVFPISSTDALTDTTNTDEAIITITGDTTYERGIEYLVTATNVSNTINGKTVPISVIVGASDGLGTSDEDYFENRGSTTSLYNVLSKGTITNGGRLVVGYIAPGSAGINGTVTIKAYLDSSLVTISDTYDGTESEQNGTTTNWVARRTVLTTSEWNSLQTNGVSFKVKVEANEGTWVENGVELYNAIIEANLPDEPGQSGSGGSSTRRIPLDSENSTYVQNIGTTSTNNARVTFLDNVESQGKVLKLSTSGIDFYQYSSETNGRGLYVRAGTENDRYPIYYYRGNVNNNNVAFAGFCWLIVRTTETGGIKLIYNGLQDENGTCLPLASSCASGESSCETSGEAPGETSSGTRRTGPQTAINVNGNNVFLYDEYDQGLSYVGYMHGTAYESKYYSKSDDSYYHNEQNLISGSYFGSGFAYQNNQYKLTNATVTSPDSTHLYSCNSVDPEATCNSLIFVIGYSKKITSSNLNLISMNFINLTGGDGIEEALTKMQTNTTSSIVKTTIDNWYAANMTNYTNYLEDTVWCNDRALTWTTMRIGQTEDYRFDNNVVHWDGANSSVTPLLTCSQANDRFTVSSDNGNGALTYPVGLLTISEMHLAGHSSDNQYMGDMMDSYLGNTFGYWSMSPDGWTVSSLTSAGRISGEGFYRAIRPSISLKAGVIALGNAADGTPSNPYVIR